jgi:hypothetical protein
MTRRKRTAFLAVLAAVCAVAIGTVATGAAPLGSGPALSDVPTTNTKSPGFAPASRLSAELSQVAVAQGSTKLEGGTAQVSYYGYDNDVLNAAGEPQMLPTPAVSNEAHKTEPDKNTYLVFKGGLPGVDPHYDYGTHFLFQGHEAGAPGYITRINLDADAAHRVTLLATTDANGAPIADIDGSTWDPWARRLLFTTENANAPTYAATPGYPSVVEDVSGALGRGGYEGIQDDGDGNIWIVEDIGGSNKPGTTAKIPNSFVYRYVPEHPGDLADGRLQVLQVLNAAGTPITQASQTAVNSPDQLALHVHGSSFRTRWLTIHDTAIDGTAPFNANTLAKSASGTPFKRPENGVFRPGTHFGDFYFDETGDTNTTSVENRDAGGWASIFRLTQPDPSANSGRLSIFYKGDQAHAGLDNIQFLSRDSLAVGEDAGDTLHGQRNALDSGFALDVEAEYSDPGNQPLRWLAEGRDASATIDSAFSGFGKNDGDNETTGIHVSNGDPSVHGILGAQTPELFHNEWRWFYTQQHGDNQTYEVLPAGEGKSADRR